ncbi:TetR/AcrR family transcriptional regulator [Nocardioides stalactiti]|uniref:TetR/AcrR family transcriptional regulator n=1 Tax=Nocardioides stalactiti TaxID=2755356 RepID=UPI0028B1EECF|nr:helix-turn-helix domain-containing protein [Nocardioides stalactiti]
MRTPVDGPGLGEPTSLLARALADVVAGADRDEPDAAVLDAAYDLFCRQGVQRTTMDDVAQRAGLSRITVYRRVTSKEVLVEQVVLREFRRYLDEFLADISRATDVGERVVLGFVSSLRAVRRNPLMAGLMTDEPQLLGPSIMGERGRTLAAVGGFVAGQLRREQVAGNVGPDVDVDVVAELMVRLTMSMLLTPSTQVDLDDDEQLAALARRYLVPMLTPPA